MSNKNEKKQLGMKGWIALILKVALAVVVVIFLGAESLNFFEFVFPPEQWYLSYTGLGLTMGTTFVYLYLLLNDADTPLKRVVALIMALVGVGGELATAGFGMQVEAWNKIGYVMTQTDLDLMVLVIRALMLVQGLALLAYFAGDQVVWMFKDDDRDGIPNAIDRQDNRNSQHVKPTNVYAKDAPQEALHDNGSKEKVFTQPPR